MQKPKKVLFLITFIGQEIYVNLKKLVTLGNLTAKSYDILVDILRKHFAPEINEIAEHYKFYEKERRKKVKP